MKTTRRIEYTPEIRRKIEEAIGCSSAMISQSLRYYKRTSLSNAIRNEAMRVGAKEIVTADADKVLLIEGNSLVWQYGDRKATIDLAHKTIIIEQDNKTEKRIASINSIIELIKEVKA